MENYHDALQTTIRRSPILEEIRLVSSLVSQLSQVGLQALEYVESDSKPNQQWVRSQQTIIEQGKAPIAEVEIMIIAAIEQMVSAAVRE